ncbi:MAG: polyprenyl synthetase family protein [Pseudomonadota bacterium]
MANPAIDDALAEYGALTRASMVDYLPKGAPSKHLSEPAADYPSRGGKMMRPSICIAAARAYGASVDEAVRLAVSIELLHNALLIHDDIEDESETRRGEPTLHIKYGLPVALNAGDALALASLRPIADTLPNLGPWLGVSLITELDRMARETAEGQAIELGWRADNTIELAPEDYLVMVLKKTCWFSTIYPLRVGAMLALRSDLPADAFVRLGFFIGAAFQIQDDILNIEADDRYGKEICGDLLEGKRTLMLIDLLHRLKGAERTRLIDTLETPRAAQKDEDVVWIRRRMIEEGSLDRAKATARGLVGAAAHEFELIFRDLPETKDKAFLRALAPWALSRAA